MSDSSFEKLDTKSSLSDPDEELASGQDALIGTLLQERIEITSVLGKGACGVVYRAKHLTLDKFVAVKVIAKSVLNDEIATKRFLNEAQLLSSFQQENIVRFQSFAVMDDGRAYMVLEYLEGETLGQLLAKSGAIEPNRALELFIQICQGLAYAHERGVIHRDLKPANVMICRSLEAETAKLLDFGIFKTTVLGTQSLTQTGAMLGTANYMSPEQCKMIDLDARSDIYSLGILMYETLVGSPPMQAESDLLVMSNQLNKIVEAIPSKLGLPGDLERVILRCLQKDRDCRFADADELLAALKACRGRAETATKAAGKSAVVPVLLALAFVFISISVIVGTMLLSKSAQRSVLTQMNKRQFHTVRPPAVDIKDGSDRALAAQENWIRLAVADPREDPEGIAAVYIRCSHSMVGKVPPCADELVTRLRTALQTHQYVGRDKQRKAETALIQVLNISGRNSETIKELKALELSASKDGVLDIYRSAVKYLFAYLAHAKRWDDAETLVREYQGFVLRHKSDLDSGLCTLMEADLHYSESHLDEAAICIDHAYEKLVNLVSPGISSNNTLTQSVPEEQVGRLLFLLNRLGRSQKAVFLLEKYFPDTDLLLPNVNSDVAIQVIKRESAIAFMKVGNYAKSRKISATYRDLSMSQLDCHEVSAAELIYLEAFVLQGKQNEANSAALSYLKNLKDKVSGRAYLMYARDIVNAFLSWKMSLQPFRKFLEPDLAKYVKTEPAICQEIRLAYQKSSAKGK